jgi:hypothetical protein
MDNNLHRQGKVELKQEKAAYLLITFLSYHTFPFFRYSFFGYPIGSVAESSSKPILETVCMTYILTTESMK